MLGITLYIYVRSRWARLARYSSMWLIDRMMMHLWSPGNSLVPEKMPEV